MPLSNQINDPHSDIFCNSPWYELHIYWDGKLGFCCQESGHLYRDTDQYNIKNLSLSDWYNSDPMKIARRMMFDQKKNKICQRCYHEESMGSTSRRIRSNQKSAIFHTNGNFLKSFKQSPGLKKFRSIVDDKYPISLPIDLHIDLGNYCNLACKMCVPEASSRIASQYIAWGIPNTKLAQDWTADQQVWNRVLEEIAGIPNLRNVHFMGGETLLTSKFEAFVDYMISKKRFDIAFSFVSNGTVFNESLIKKLSHFRRIGIEISIESITDHNDYVRQGTCTRDVLDNIDRYRQYVDEEKFSITLRSTISLLTIGSYVSLLEYCLQQKFLIKSLLVTEPRYLDARIIPEHIKRDYLSRYVEFQNRYGLDQINITDINESDPNNTLQSVKLQLEYCINLLTAPSMENNELLYSELVHWCKKWDSVYKLDASTLYPEFEQIFYDHGYRP